MLHNNLFNCNVVTSNVLRGYLEREYNNSILHEVSLLHLFWTKHDENPINPFQMSQSVTVNKLGDSDRYDTHACKHIHHMLFSTAL